MAGFRFRTRTKSKYDRPPPANFLEQSQKEAFLKRKGTRGKSSNEIVLVPDPVSLCSRYFEFK